MEMWAKTYPRFFFAVIFLLLATKIITPSRNNRPILRGVMSQNNGLILVY